MKNKIAVIGLKGLPSFGGAASVGENIINQLKNEFDFTVYSISSHTNLKTGYYSGYKQIVFKKIPFKKLNSLYYYILSALHTLLVGNYDLIHLHHYDAAFIVPLLRLKYKVILTTHGFSISKKWDKFKIYFKIQIKFFLKYANILTSVSQVDIKLLQNKYRLNSFYIPNGIIVSKNKNCELKKEDYILFAAARIIDVKGCDILIKAINIMQEQIRLVIIGDFTQDTEYYNYLQSLIKDGNKIEFVGLIRDKNYLKELICKSKLFVFPSRHESMSMMLLEVISLKIPVICSNISANKNIFNYNEVIFFENNNPKDLALKINYFIKNEAKLKYMIENAYNKVVSKYNISVIAKQYASIYLSQIND